MKKLWIYIFIITNLLNYSFSGIAQTGRDQSFGKTHFIVGLPKEQHLVQQQSPQVRSDHSFCLPFQNPQEQVKHAFFSPDDNIKKILIDLIDAEQKAIKVTAFMVTDKDIAQALINAQCRGIAVEVITDGNSSKDRFSKIPMLKDSKITVYTYQPQSSGIVNDIMHNKFIVFKDNIHHKSLLWTGSFNLTKSANDRNHENVLIVEEPCLVEQYEKRFEYLKTTIKKTDKEEFKKYSATLLSDTHTDKQAECRRKNQSIRFTQTAPRKQYAKDKSSRPKSKNIIRNVLKVV
ncbi:MAG: phospholipase D-like domain-containing protein [Candidatus Dependentiae bacterium]|nr:phospholipase D-like domain-containing protein [Candidatus Dependentiae bacterium]